MNIGKIGLIIVGLGLGAGCASGPFISLDHYSEGYGQAPPIPHSGGSGPVEINQAIDVPTDAVTFPAQLPELLALYRQKLVDTAHPFGAGLAEEYADKEIAGLRTRYAGRDDVLRTEVMRRLHPMVARPGTPADLKGKRPRYPSEESNPQTDQMRAQ